MTLLHAEKNTASEQHRKSMSESFSCQQTDQTWKHCLNIRLCVCHQHFFCLPKDQRGLTASLQPVHKSMLPHWLNQWRLPLPLCAQTVRLPSCRNSPVSWCCLPDSHFIMKNRLPWWGLSSLQFRRYVAALGWEMHLWQERANGHFHSGWTSATVVHSFLKLLLNFSAINGFHVMLRMQGWFRAWNMLS